MSFNRGLMWGYLSYSIKLYVFIYTVQEYLKLCIKWWNLYRIIIILEYPKASSFKQNVSPFKYKENHKIR